MVTQANGLSRPRSTPSHVQSQADRAHPGRRRPPFPAFALEQSLVIARAIADNNAAKPYSRLSLAESIDRSPESSAFRQLITSSSAYGLTEGSYSAPQIKLTELGLSIVAPRSDVEKRGALIKAAMNIALFKRLYEHFDQHKIPAHENLANTLVRDYQVSPELVDNCVSRFFADGKFVGLIREIAGADRVSVQDASGSAPVHAGAEIEDEVPTDGDKEETQNRSPSNGEKAPSVVSDRTRVLISHGKNQEIVKQLKDLLTFGKFVPIVAVEHETTSKPVPEKVMADMRSCFAGIIHIASEEELLDRDGNIHHKINENVLIEIGAAMALYKENFILLAQKGIHLPSNLQGLYRCDYEGDKLDYDATMRILKAISTFK